MSDSAITNQIRKFRFQNGEITQAELAEQVGVTRQTINAIEAAKYAPSLELAFKIADAFDKPLEEVFQYRK
ncbi:MAG: helix-turn-helix transcriptional regulator [Gracilimonas sp.]|jgi:putative transcriptional regulator|nr:helix-turn-helix transcriptional regulator [Gracilimonas sp.]